MYGSKISSIRMARGYTQDFVADKLGIKQASYSDIEKDVRVRIEEKMLQDIAMVLGVSVEDIKSPTPIVMTFNSHDNSTAVGQQHNSFDKKVLDALLCQLDNKDVQIKHKDAQIEILLSSIKKN
jgi:transcriptional regulator with XRE-family HTH domain